MPTLWTTEIDADQVKVYEKSNKSVTKNNKSISYIIKKLASFIKGKNNLFVDFMANQISVFFMNKKPPTCFARLIDPNL